MQGLSDTARSPKRPIHLDLTIFQKCVSAGSSDVTCSRDSGPVFSSRDQDRAVYRFVLVGLGMKLAS